MKLIFEFGEDFRWKDPVFVIFLVSPDCNCPHVPHDVAAGKCKRNQDGKVVLPSGAYVPRDITSKFLHDCINEWHGKNPNQLGAATLIHMIDKHILDKQKSPSSSVYQLTMTDCIVVLEAKLYNLWARRQNFFPYPNLTGAQKARNANIEIEDK